MLRFKLDENLPTEAATALCDACFAAVTVLDREQGKREKSGKKAGKRERESI